MLVKPIKQRTTTLSKTMSDASAAGLFSLTMLFVLSATIALSLILIPPEDMMLINGFVDLIRHKHGLCQFLDLR